MEKTSAAILGSGNIGTDLMYKLLRSDTVRPTVMAGIVPESDGLARGRQEGLTTTHKGIDGLLEHAGEFEIVFDATTARAHAAHAPLLKKAGKVAVDLTPAAVGPYVIPLVNLDAHVGEPNVNLVSCGGQATVPLVSAMENIPDDVLEAALSLGANRLTTFLRIVVPLSSDGLVLGATLVFTGSVTAFVTPAILGGSRLLLMSTLLRQKAVILFDQHAAAVVAVVMVLTTLAVNLLLRVLRVQQT